MSNDGKRLPYDERVWTTDENGEAKYIGEETLTITFETPLALSDADKKPVAAITLKEPTASHLSTFMTAQRTKDEARAGIEFIAANCGEAPAYIAKMKSRDFQKAMEFLGGFTPPEKKAEV